MKNITEVVPGISVGTFEDVRGSSFPIDSGLTVIEVMTGKGKETPVQEVISLLEHIRDLPEREKPYWVSMVFGGWDDDKRPVVNIPECTNWLRKFVTDAGPDVLCVLMWEPEAISTGKALVAESGFGIFKILCAAGYGAPVVGDGADASESAYEKNLANDGPQVTYELNDEGEALAEAACLKKLKYLTGAINRATKGE